MTPASRRGPTIVLASTSPRRREILTLLGLPFEAVSPRFEEILSDRRSIAEEVAAFAEGKARSIIEAFPESILIGSDTMIECDGKKIGKPRDAEDAARTLRLLSGRTHRIWTAVCLIDPLQPPSQTALETIDVAMRPMSDGEIASYVATGEPLDKAGAYSLQGEGKRWIDRLEGDYLAAVGLPIRPVVAFLRSRGIAVPLDLEPLYRERDFMNWKSF